MAGIVSISVPSHSLNPLPRPHVEFHVQVAGPVRSWTVRHRYSDFDQLNNKLKELLPGQGPPQHLVTFPPKGNPLGGLWRMGNDSADFLDDRRRGLEAWLRGVMAYAPRWTESDAWMVFLAVPRQNGSAATSTSSLPPSPNGATNRASSPAPPAQNPTPPPPPLDPRAWLDEHDSLRSLARDLRLLSTNRPPPTAPRADAHDHARRAARGLAQMDQGIDRLDAALRHDAKTGHALSPGEMARRMDMVDALRTERSDVARLVQTKPADTDGKAAQARVQLLGAAAASGGHPGGGVAAPRRRFGAANPVATLDPSTMETPATHGVPTPNLLGLQTQLMSQQDDTLLLLANAARRQHEVARALGEELDLQNRLLDEVEGEVERVGGRMTKAGKRLDKVAGTGKG